MAEELWIGRGEVRPLSADSEIADATWAFATVTLRASSAEEFLSRFDEELAAAHLGLVKLETAVPAHEWFDVDEEFFAAFVEAAQSGEPVLYVINTDEPEDAEDADTVMLQAAARSGTAVQFRFIGADDWVHGFVVGADEDWALVHALDLTAIRLDGYAAVRLDEVIEVEELDTDRHFVFRALESQGVLPVDPEIPLVDHRSILTAVADRYTLVGLGETQLRDGVAVGKIVEVGEERVTLAGVNTVGVVTGDAAHAFEDIREIRFGTAYLDALASLLD